MTKTRFDILLGKDIPVIDPPIYLLPCCSSEHPTCNRLINNNCTCLQYSIERMKAEENKSYISFFTDAINLINNIISSKSKAIAMLNMNHYIPQVRLIANFILGLNYCKYHILKDSKQEEDDD